MTQISSVGLSGPQLRPRRTLNRIALVLLAVIFGVLGQAMLKQDGVWDGIIFFGESGVVLEDPLPSLGCTNGASRIGEFQSSPTVPQRRTKDYAENLPIQKIVGILRRRSTVRP